MTRKSMQKAATRQNGQNAAISKTSISPNTLTEITPEEILNVKAPTDGFLIPANNLYKHVVFTAFKLRDPNSGFVLYDASAPENLVIDWDKLPDVTDEDRTIRYTFDKRFFELKSVATGLTFSVGPQDITGLRLIERHFYVPKDSKDPPIHLKTHDFSMPFCMKNSKNSFEIIYDLPKLDPKTVEEIIDSPERTISDAFWFIDGKLAGHNKAFYTFKALHE